MMFTPIYDAPMCRDFGLNGTLGQFIQIVIQAATWANRVSVDGVEYYQLAQNKVIEELPCEFSDKSKVTRATKRLADMGVLVFVAQGRNNFYRVSDEFSRFWMQDCKQSDAYISFVEQFQKRDTLKNETVSKMRVLPKNTLKNESIGGFPESPSKTHSNAGSDEVCSKSDTLKNESYNITTNNITTNNITNSNNKTKARSKKSSSGNSQVSVKKTSRFAKPSVDDVRAYCSERGNSVDADHFVDHYSSNGWMVGKTKMKDWRAAVRTWERRDNNQQGFARKGRAARSQLTPSAGGQNVHDL